MPFSSDFKNYLRVITIRKKIAGERKGHLREVIQDCVNERESAGKGLDG